MGSCQCLLDPRYSWLEGPELEVCASGVPRLSPDPGWAVSEGHVAYMPGELFVLYFSSLYSIICECRGTYQSPSVLTSDILAYSDSHGNGVEVW